MKNFLFALVIIMLLSSLFSSCSKPTQSNSKESYGKFVDSDEAFTVPDAPDAVVGWPDEWNSSEN